MKISKEKIAQYLAGELLPPQEIDAIENMLQSDEARASEILAEFGENSLDDTVIDGLQIVGEEKSKAKISSVHEELKKDGFFEKKSENKSSSTKVRPMFSRQLLRWAASVAILLGIGFFVYQNFSGTASPGALAAGYKNEISNDDFSVVDNLRSDPTELDPLIEKWQTVETDFNAGNYAAARQKLLAFDQKTITDFSSDYHFQLGIAEWKSGNPDAALAAFDKLSNTARAKEADWYRALIFIEKDQLQNARPLLRSLADKQGKFSKNAKKLLDAME